jgi:diacylglycerol O-acyltransferase / wax synthase
MMASNRPPDATIRLSGSDTTFILDEAVESQHTLKIAVFDEASSRDFQFDRVSEALAGAATVLPQMRWRVQRVPFGLNRPMWITDPDFDVRKHLRHAVLPVPGTKTQLCRMIGDIASEPVPLDQPPWELWFLEGFEGSKVVAVLKMNHAMADGGTFAKLLDMLTSTQPGGSPVVPAVPRLVTTVSRGDALRDGARDLWNGVRHELPRRIRAVAQARAKARASASAARRPSMLRAPKLPWRGPVTPRRSFSWSSVPLEDVKQIKNAVSGTINDVILAIVAGAVRRHLAEQGLLPDRPALAFTAATNRKAGDTRLWGTAATSRPVELPTHLADPLERLRAARAQNAAAKADVAARSVQMEDLFDFAPPIILTPMLRLWRLVGQRIGGGVIVSDVMGPKEKRYIGGMGIENFLSCGHLKYAAGVNITVWSYNTMLNFAVYGCTRTLPDAELLTQQIQSSFEELRAAAGMSRNPSNGTESPEPAQVNTTAAEGREHV